MKELIYKFLDDYCREDIVCVREAGVYRMISGKVIIFSFSIHGKDDTFIFYPSYEINNSLQSMFNLTKNESIQYVKDWIGDKLYLKRNHDLKRYIPEGGGFLF